MFQKTTDKTHRRLKKCLAATISSIFALLLIIIPTPALKGARDGLALCGNTVIPSLFPFLVVSAFVIGSGISENIGRLFEPVCQKLFSISGSSATPLILGAIGGYPVGASAVTQTVLNGSISKKEASRLLCFAINSSPAFIIGAVGAGFLNSPTAGILLYVSHLLTSFLIGLILKPRKTKQDREQQLIISKQFSSYSKKQASLSKSKSIQLTTAFVNAVISSAKSIITICAFVILFSSITAILKGVGLTDLIDLTVGSNLPVPNQDTSFYSRILVGSLEVTNGCFLASNIGGMATVLMTSAFLGFCSLSVQFQVISLVKEADIDTKLFIVTRFLNVIISLIITFLLFSIFNSALPEITTSQAFSQNISGMTATSHSCPTVSAMFILIGLFLLSLVKV